jgi:hypothetical protein
MMDKLAQLIREAIDGFLKESKPSPDEVLRSTFGTMPNLKVPPRSDWDRA